MVQRWKSTWFFFWGNPFCSAFNTFSPSSEPASRLPGCHRRKFQRPAWCPQLPSHSWHSAEPTHSGQSAWRTQHARHKARKAPELPQPMLPALPFCSTFHCRSTCLHGNRFPHQLGPVAPPRIPPWCFKGWLGELKMQRAQLDSTLIRIGSTPCFTSLYNDSLKNLSNDLCNPSDVTASLN